MIQENLKSKIIILRNAIYSTKINTLNVAWSVVALFLNVLNAMGFRININMLQAERIGPLASEADIFYRLKLIDKKEKQTLRLFISGNTYNRPLMKNIRKYIHVISSSLLYDSLSSAKSRNSIVDKCKHIHIQNSDSYSQIYNSTDQCMGLDDEISREVDKYLFELGLPKDAWFVCIHNRDTTYLDNFHNGRDWSYHDYRDCSIQNYMKAAEYIVNRGGYVFRMGASVKEAIRSEKTDHIIDYANTNRNDALDVGLIARSKMFLGSTSGLSCVANMFNVPVCLANIIPFNLSVYGAKDLFIPKLLLVADKDRFLSFAEAKEIGLFDHNNKTLNTEFYHQNGLVVIENSPEDILDLAIEKLDYLFDTEKHEDQNFAQLQKKFKEQYLSHLKGSQYAGNIGGRFLEKYKYLM